MIDRKEYELVTSDLPAAEARVSGVLRGGFIGQSDGIFYFCSGIGWEESNRFEDLRIMQKPEQPELF